MEKTSNIWTSFLPFFAHLFLSLYQSNLITLISIFLSIFVILFYLFSFSLFECKNLFPRYIEYYKVAQRTILFFSKWKQIVCLLEGWVR